MTITPFGKFEYNENEKKWFGLVENISPNNKIELSIYVHNKYQNLTDKIELVTKFTEDYDSIVSDLYDLSYKKYKDTEFELSREQIDKMYFLSAIDLKEDNRTWWLTLEPDFDVTSIYNHFLRFTMQDRKVIWANFDIKLV